MAKLTGSVDDMGRPLVRIGIKGLPDDVLVIVDTGFNGDLMMGFLAAQQMKVAINEVRVQVELGTGQTETVRNGTLSILWMGQGHLARVLVSDTWPAPKGDAPVALVGTRLLRPHLLLVDFDSSTVEIETTA